MSDQLQLPVITNGLDDKELKLHLLVLASHFCNRYDTLEQAKEWSDWVINNK